VNWSQVWRMKPTKELKLHNLTPAVALIMLVQKSGQEVDLSIDINGENKKFTFTS